MANKIVRGFAEYVSYGWETVAFGTKATTIDKVLGRNVRYSFTPSRKLTRVPDLNNQEAATLSEHEYGGTWNATFQLANPWFLRALWGAAPATTGSSPYTHTWDSSQGVSDFQPSITLNLGQDNVTTDDDAFYLGCVVSSAAFNFSIGNPVEVTLSGVFRSTDDDTTIESSPPSESEEPFVGRQVSVKFDGSRVAFIENGTLTIDRKTELVPDLSVTLAADYLENQRDYSASITAPFVNRTDFINKFEGGSSTQDASTAFSSFALNITNAGAGAAERSFTMTFGTTKIENYDRSGGAGEEKSMAPISLIPQTLTDTVAVNNTAAAP